MIVSIHVPKTAGQSFRAYLQAQFGPRLYLDYGDGLGLETAENIARREANLADLRRRRDELMRDYDVVHGHFTSAKYLDIFPRADFVAFFRDPYQQAVSHYEFLMRQPAIDYPPLVAFRETAPSLTDFIALTPNIQSMFSPVSSLDQLAMVGLAEEYARSVALFGLAFGRPHDAGTHWRNVNPDRPGDAYPISQAVRRAVETHRGADLELYRRARERFAQLAARYDI